MKELLRRIQLITPFALEFPVEPTQFVGRLQPHVAPPNLNPFGRLGRLFSPTVAPYSGVVRADYVQLKPRPGGNQLFFPAFNGTVLPTPAGTRLEGELNGASGTFLFPALFYLAFVLFAFVSLLTRSENTTLADVLIALSMLVFQGLIAVGIPYVIARRRLQRAAFELERDLFYFIQKPTTEVR
ncbi:hypothetical protein [Hymenobacter sp. APR13]|uniref:hypothetical protein n=1 Tax=Hymenobacter sp. APR13 TaxID=1356852 RepID=UPI0004E06979|nr:hypothetical protein [Hymenobacter sp. APR13]AII53517.1 hypothetical protein N008_16230 [Hymenobacter sp. APR13]